MVKPKFKEESALECRYAQGIDKNIPKRITLPRELLPKQIGGTNSKEYRFCLSELLPTLFEDLSSDECSYKTYLDNYIRARKAFESKGEIAPPLPEYIVALYKDLHMQRDSDMYCGIASTKVGNMLGIPMAYNQGYTDENDNNHILSVNFIPNGKGFVTLGECLPKNTILDYFAGFDYWERAIKGLDKIVAHKHISSNAGKLKYRSGCNIKLSEEKKSQLIKDFIPTYLFRTLVIKDTDFTKNNIGFIFDKTSNTVEWAPNFDVEMGLNERRLAVLFDSEVVDKLLPVYRKYPEIVDKFVCDLNKKIDYDKLRHEFEKSMPDEPYKEDYIKQLKRNIDSLVSAYEKISGKNLSKT